MHMLSGSGHEAADGAGAVPAGYAQGVAISDKQSRAIMGMCRRP